MKLLFRTARVALVPVLPVAVSLCLAAPLFGQAKPALFSRAETIAEPDTKEVMEAKVWLNLHDKKGLDQAVAAMYDAKSPNYHHWLKSADLAKYLPTASDAAVVEKELMGKGLTITEVADNHGYVKVQGSVGTMQSAFHTEIKTLTAGGRTMRAAVTAPKLEGAAGAMVAAVTGLTETAATQDIMQVVDPDTGQAYPGIAAASMDGKAFASQCFYGAQTQVIATLHATTPTATYSGTRYGASNTNTAAGTLPPCGYDAANLQGAYGLNEVYARGVDGSGQTIVIVDAYEQPTIKDDVNTYSKLNGLPKLGASNFQVVYPEGKPKSQDLSATQETSLDVEMAHMVAPGANIALVLSPSLYLSDLETCVFYAISHDLGSVISNSYGAPEAFVDEQDLLIEDSISELGAALGIAVNYSTGDYGDWAVLYGIPTVSMPADSPYSTAVGGTSLSINANNQMVFQTGWGMNVTKIGAGINGLTTGPLNPVINLGFNGGAGGGESGFFVKPFWQYELPGIGRQQPDISFDADPYTGAEVVYTVDGVQIISTLGGTSLACPSFSAIWALANQRAGQLYGEGALLGQAAPYIADLAGTTAITDVKPYASYDVAGYYYGGHGSIFYSPNQLAAPLENTTEFLSALYNGASGAWYTLTFGTDSSLVVSPGWDNVTGFGTPNGWDFVNAAAKLP